MTWVDDSNAALLTDLYELTMAASYHGRGMNEEATFDLFVRSLPERRNFLIACGVETALDYLTSVRFDEVAIEHLGSLDMFPEAFLDYLHRFRFTGEVHAVEEGEAVFGSEPLLRITAPLIEGQLVETFLLNCVIFQTMIASKAARISLACRGRNFVDFSPRRDHGADAALKAARAAFVGGASATSNVLAGMAYGIPVSGTMAHSYVMAFDSERDAFAAFARDFPDRAVLLIDTFDVESGARNAADVARELNAEGVRLRGVRIDSGDLAHLARGVRKILDETGLQETQIVLSGDLDEYRIAELVRDDVPVDSFGVGTQLGTSGDAPTLGGVYKLVAGRGRPKMKTSSGKATLPGVKQVYRLEREGIAERDVIALENEDPPEGSRPLLRRVMTQGEKIAETAPLTIARERCAATIRGLPDDLKMLSVSRPFPVHRSAGLDKLVSDMGTMQH